MKWNESGLDFQVVFATDVQGKEWVLRIPRREDVLSTAQQEKKILDLVVPRLPIQAPVWEIFNKELIAYKRLNGVPAGTIDPEARAYVWEIDADNVPEKFHETLGSALAALHRIPHEEARQAGVSVETAAQVRQSMKERIELVKTNFGVDEALWKRWMAWLHKDELWPEETGLIHGDLHAGHILIGEEARVIGLIDWTEAKVSDVANDFVGHYRTFGSSALKDLIDSYARAGGIVWPGMYEHVIELAAAYPVSIAEFAMKSGLKEYEEMAKQVLGVK